MHGRFDPWRSDDHAKAGNGEWRQQPTPGHDNRWDDHPEGYTSGEHGYGTRGYEVGDRDAPGGFPRGEELRERYADGTEIGGRFGDHTEIRGRAGGAGPVGGSGPVGGAGGSGGRSGRQPYHAPTQPGDPFAPGQPFLPDEPYTPDPFATPDGYAEDDRYGPEAYAAENHAGPEVYPADNRYGPEAYPADNAGPEVYPADNRYGPEAYPADNAGPEVYPADDRYGPGPAGAAPLAPWDGVDARDRFDIQDRLRPAAGARHGSDDTVLIGATPSRRGLRLPGPLGLAALVTVLLLTFGVGAALLAPNLGGRTGDGEVAGQETVDLPADGAGGDSTATPTPGATATPSRTATPAPTRSATPTKPPARSTPTPRRTTTKPKPKASKTTSVTVPAGNAAQEDQVVSLVNAERAKNGCPSLKMDSRLRAGARAHSQDMAANDYFAHTSPDGRAPWDFAHAAGYPQNTAMGENIAMGQQNAQSVVEAWMNSEGHRANILNCGYKGIGVGLIYDYQRDGNSTKTPIWTQLFGSVAG